MELHFANAVRIGANALARRWDAHLRRAQQRGTPEWHAHQQRMQDAEARRAQLALGPFAVPTR